jgi:GNAT superfamily N-acetyltransferase
MADRMPTPITYRLSQSSLFTYSPAVLLASNRWPGGSEASKDFYASLDDCDATHAVVAQCEGDGQRLNVGRFRFTFDDGRFCAQGTYVEKSWRGNDIARTMWKKALRALRPKLVEVTTVSKGGAMLVKSIAEDPHAFHLRWTNDYVEIP